MHKKRILNRLSFAFLALIIAFLSFGTQRIEASNIFSEYIYIDGERISIDDFEISFEVVKNQSLNVFGNNSNTGQDGFFANITGIAEGIIHQNIHIHDIAKLLNYIEFDGDRVNLEALWQLMCCDNMRLQTIAVIITAPEGGTVTIWVTMCVFCGARWG